MTTVYRSLAIPACMSTLAMTATLIYFDRWQRRLTVHPPGGIEIGFLKKSSSDIERRPKTRVLWQALPSGSSVYSGDSVRTPEGVEGKVQLSQGDTLVTLEPNSLIVFDASEGQLELELVSGSLLVDDTAKGAVKKSDKKAPGPVIKSGKTRVAIGAGGSQFTLAKKQGQAAQIAVAKGEVAVNIGQKNITVDQGKSGTLNATGVTLQTALVIKSPAAVSTLVLANPQEGRANVAFAPLGPEVRVAVEVGASRTEMQSTGLTVPGPSGALSFQVKAGTTFFRLVARSAQGQIAAVSVPMRIDTLYLAPPVLYTPASNAVFVQDKSDQDVRFSWSIPEGAKSATVIVGRDSQLRDPILKATYANDSETSVPLPADGTYYWRVVAAWEASVAPVGSEVRRFEVKPPAPLAAPTLEAPATATRVAEATGLDGVTFSWSKVAAAGRYELEIVSGSGPARRVSATGTSTKVANLGAGNYEWKVRAIPDRGEASPFSAPQTLSITRPQEIRWRTPARQVQRFGSGPPIAVIAWDPTDKGGAIRYRVRGAPSTGSLDGAKWIAVTTPSARLPQRKEGVFQFEVEGLDADGRVVAVSKPIEIELRPELLLPAPSLVDKRPGPLAADRDGTLRVQWSPVAGAKSYVARLTGKNSKSGREASVDGTEVTFKDLLPGDYELTLTTINVAGKPGKASPTRRILVPVLSNIPPPPAVEIKVH